MSSVVLARECRICPCASFTSAPAIFSQTACEVCNKSQFTQGKPNVRAAGLMNRIRKKEVQFVETKGTPALDSKYEEIKGMLYEKAAKPRYTAGLLLGGPLLFTKSKKHFLTFHYIDSAGTPRYAIIHLEKSNFQEALARAESETGKKVEHIEQHGRV